MKNFMPNKIFERPAFTEIVDTLYKGYILHATGKSLLFPSRAGHDFV